MGIYSLSKSESEIMEFLWKQEDTCLLHDIVTYCTTEKQHTWKQQTIYTFLVRLEQKGAVTAVKHGHKRYYSASMSVTEFKKKATRQLLEENFNGSLKEFLTAYTGGRAMNEEDRSILREFLGQIPCSKPQGI